MHNVDTVELVVASALTIWMFCGGVMWKGRPLRDRTPYDLAIAVIAAPVALVVIVPGIFAFFIGAIRRAVTSVRSGAQLFAAWGNGTSERGDGAMVFDLLSLILPKRVADEELGDAMEQVATMVERGEPRWRVWIKIASAAIWAITNSVRFGTRLPPKPAAPGTSQDPRPPARRE